MCKLTAYHAQNCQHTTKYSYAHCADSPYPKRCPELISSIANTTIDEDQAWCSVCWQNIKAKMTADFHAERRMVTATARVEGCWTDEEISMMRTELRDQYYEKVKYSNRPLPKLPEGMGEGSSTNVSGNGSSSSIFSDGSSSNASSETFRDLDPEEAAEIRAQLKEWTYKKLDYLVKPLPAESVPANSPKRGKDLWLERDDSGLQLRYVNAPHYGGNKARLSRSLPERGS